MAVAIDYDIFANDARLLAELPRVAAVGMIRVYPRECWRRFTAADRREPYAAEAALGYPSFHDASRRAALEDAAGSAGFAFKDGTNYGVIGTPIRTRIPIDEITHDGRVTAMATTQFDGICAKGTLIVPEGSDAVETMTATMAVVQQKVYNEDGAADSIRCAHNQHRNESGSLNALLSDSELPTGSSD